MNIRDCNEIATKEWNCTNIGNKQIEFVEAKNLFVNSRLDLVVKYKYVEMYEKGLECRFFLDLYRAHLEAFSKGTYKEPGKEKEKGDFLAYKNKFDELINKIRKNGVNPQISVIPVGKDNTILNGAHRVAIAAYFGMKVPIVRFEDIETEFDYKYFEKRLLDEHYLDYIVTEYIKYKKGVYFACVWPMSDQNSSQEIKKIFENKTKIIYRKEVLLTDNGFTNLLIHIYGHQQWCGNIDNQYKGIKDKVERCFKENVPITIYIFEGRTLDEVIELKQEIRNIFNIGNDSIHISDNSDESLSMAYMLLNPNSVHALNNANMMKEKDYIKKIQNFATELRKNNIDIDDILIDSSGVLGIYGLRKPSDIDYLSFITLKNTYSGNIDKHDRNIIYHSKNKADIIFNPNNYLYAYGLKFLSLDVLYDMKKRRNEPKDREDCELIRTLNSKNFKTVFKKHDIRIKRILRNCKGRARYRVTSLLKAVHLYEKLRSLYHKLRGVEDGEK